MSQFNSNRSWVFETAYETSSVLYEPNVGRPTAVALNALVQQPATRAHGAVVAVEVTRLDGLAGADY